MGLGDFLYRNFNPEERRWREEARQEAKEYRQDAKDYLSDAKDLYEDYKELKGDARRLANQLGNSIKNLNNYKSKILTELGSEVTTTIENFRRFNIDVHVSAPNSSSAPSIPSFDVSSFMANIPGGSFNPISIALSALSDPYKDRDKAMKQRDDAREYLYKVKDAYHEIKYAVEDLNATQKFIDSEKILLEQLMDKIRKIMAQLKDAMNKSSHTQSEAKHMKAICNIAEKIKSSLELKITDNSGSIQSNYKDCVQQLRRINDSIPSQPSISNSTWLDNVISW